MRQHASSTSRWWRSSITPVRSSGGSSRRSPRTAGAVAALRDQLDGLELALTRLHRLRGSTVATYDASDEFGALAAETRAADGRARRGGYAVHIRGNRVRVEPVRRRARHERGDRGGVREVQAGRGQGLPGQVPRLADMNHVEAQILDLVARLHPETFMRSWSSSVRATSDYLDDDDRPVRPRGPVLPRVPRVHCAAEAAGLAFSLPARVSSVQGGPRRRRVRSRAGGEARARRRIGGVQRLPPLRPRADPRRERPEQRWQDDVRADVRPAALPGEPGSSGARDGRATVRSPTGSSPTSSARRTSRHSAASSRTSCVRIHDDPRAGDERQRADHERELRLDDAARRAARRQRGGEADRRTSTRSACS